MEAILILGVAGSGKSTLTRSLGTWLSERYQAKACMVNLDPGAELLPYTPDVDVRRYISLREVMRREGLGPNGALIRCVELILDVFGRLVDEMTSSGSDYIIIDTPGQMDLFALRPVGRRIVEAISNICPLAGVFLGDHEPGRELEDAAFAALMSRLIELKLAVPVVPVVNKKDLWSELPVERLWASLISGELVAEGVVGETLRELARAMSSFSRPVRIIGISAIKGEGLEELMDLLKEVWCSCGDMT